MKATVFLILTFLASLHSKGQSVRPIDSVWLKNIQIHGISNQYFSLTEKSNDWEKLFNVDLIEKDAKTDLGYTFYKYKGLLVGFHEVHFMYASIKNPQYQVIVNKKSYKIGDNIHDLVKEFPLSYKASSSPSILIRIRPQGAMDDNPFINFNYDNDKLITEILISNVH